MLGHYQILTVSDHVCKDWISWSRNTYCSGYSYLQLGHRNHRYTGNLPSQLFNSHHRTCLVHQRTSRDSQRTRSGKFYTYGPQKPPLPTPQPPLPPPRKWSDASDAMWLVTTKKNVTPRTPLQVRNELPTISKQERISNRDILAPFQSPTQTSCGVITSLTSRTPLFPLDNLAHWSLLLPTPKNWGEENNNWRVTENEQTRLAPHAKPQLLGQLQQLPRKALWLWGVPMHRILSISSRSWSMLRYHRPRPWCDLRRSVGYILVQTDHVA